MCLYWLHRKYLCLRVDALHNKGGLAMTGQPVLSQTVLCLLAPFLICCHGVQVEAFRKKDLALLGAFAPDSPELAAFLAAAEAMREDFDCAHVLDASLLAEVQPGHRGCLDNATQPSGMLYLHTRSGHAERCCHLLWHQDSAKHLDQACVCILFCAVSHTCPR